MAKKKQEMLQVYNGNNEFIFGEKGGRGKHLLLFLKNLLLTGLLRSTDNINEINSSIYGNLAYGTSNEPKRPQLKRLISSQALERLTQDPLTRTSSPKARSVSQGLPRQFRRPTYTDLDDDWDAQIDSVAEESSSEQPRITGMGSSGPQYVVDLLYPDLTVPAVGVEKDKVLMDSQDLAAAAEVAKVNQMRLRIDKFKRVLTGDEQGISIRELRKLAWNGVPLELRAVTWQLLLGYLPTNRTRQGLTLRRKRQEYLDGLAAVNSEQLFAEQEPLGSSNRDNSANKEKQLNHQIRIDVKRTNPNVRLYALEPTQRLLRRILYLWALRHPASGYVQGINDLVVPFYQIFLANYLWQLQRTKAAQLGDEDDLALFLPGMHDDQDEAEQKILQDPQLMSLSWENFDTGRLLERATRMLEADTYWCLLRLLDNITDNYIHEQPGILRQVNDLRNLIAKIDLPLLQHLESEGVEFLQFAFRWMNCLLMRELLVPLIIRTWDTYLSELPLGFNEFHVYVCAAFLVKFSGELRTKDFQEILLFLQNPPTKSWTDKDVELMLSEAYIWQSLYKNAAAHLR